MDPQGNRILLIAPDNKRTVYDYDELNRLETLTLDDQQAVTYEYFPDGLKKKVTNPNGTVSTYLYDAADRMTEISHVGPSQLVYDYDPQGNRTLLIDPDSVRTQYTYDELNRLETLNFGDGQSVTYEYFPDGLKNTVTNPNSTTSTYLYDAADRMTDITHTGPAAVVSAYQYFYDPNSNRERQVETNAGRTETTDYTYDFVNRLKTVTYPDRTTAYAYDLNGNRIQEVTTGAEASDKTFDYDAINRLERITDNLGDEDVIYSYDANGNTTSKTAGGVTTNFFFDIRDQLGEVRQGPSTLGRYGYDYNGRRILKIGDDGRRQYTYDQLSVITEADPVNATVSKYDYGMDQLVRLDNRAEGRSFFHLDFLGSTVGLTDPAGAARQSIFYDAWGNERDRIGASANNFTFTGHEKDDERGLIYANARFYDPDIGRFLSQDPLFGKVNFAPSLNRYSYAFSNPLVFVDLDGLQATRPGRIEGKIGETAVYTEDLVVRADSTTCESACPSDAEESEKKNTGVVEELKTGDSGFTEGSIQRVGEMFGGRQPPTPDWKKSWARNFAESFADEAAFTIAEPAVGVQYGLLTDDPEQIAIGVGEQIAAVVLSKGLTVGAEKAAAAAIAKYPWLAKPITEAMRDASVGLKGELQKQASATGSEEP